MANINFDWLHYDAESHRHYKEVDGLRIYGAVSMSGTFLPDDKCDYATIAAEPAKAVDTVMGDPKRDALRDQFAMHAMAALIGCGDPKGVAIRAYDFADAMMVARDLS